MAKPGQTWKPIGTNYGDGFTSTPPKDKFTPAKPSASTAANFPAPAPPVKLGWARLESNSGLKVECLLGPDGARPTDGYGGWEEIERPHKKPITDWKAGKPYRMTVQLHLDGFISGASVEPAIQALEQMGRRDAGDKPPPRIRCTLPAGLPRSPKVVWVVEGLDWDEGEEGRAYNGAGQRSRQRVNVMLLEFVGDDLIKVSPAKAQRKQKGKGSSTYTVKKGDNTLAKIARKFSLPLSDVKKANPKVRDKIKVGQKLKIPDEGSKAVVG